MKKITLFLFLSIFSLSSYSLSIFDKKFKCVNNEFKDQIISLIVTNKEMSINMVGKNLQLDLMECKTNKHESMYVTKGFSCSNSDEKTYYVFNNVSNTLVIPYVTSNGYKGYKYECTKTN